MCVAVRVTGAASNKLLARLVSKRGSGLYDVQTLLRCEDVPALLRRVPVKSVPGLKGKLGDAVTAQTQAQVLADLQRVPRQALGQLFGATAAAWLHAACRGVDGAAVVPNAPPKSILVERSFPPARSRSSLLEAVAALGDRLVARGLEHAARHQQVPGAVTVTCRQRYDAMLSKRVPVPPALMDLLAGSAHKCPTGSPPARGGRSGGGGGAGEAVTASAMSAICDHLVASGAGVDSGGGLAVTRVALTLINFAPPPISRSIKHFFGAAPTDRTRHTGSRSGCRGASVTGCAGGADPGHAPAVAQERAPLHGTPVPLPAPQAAAWACHACTFVHAQNPHGLVCSMCGTPRTATAENASREGGAGHPTASASASTTATQSRVHPLPSPRQTLDSFGFKKQKS